MKRSFLLIVSLFALPAALLAHSSLTRTEPKEGAALKVAPTEIRMWFSEPIKAGLSTIAVRDAAGKQVDQSDLHPDEKEPALVHLSLAANLAPGVYKVTWNAVAQDLHVAKGSFTFRIAP